MLNRGGKVKTLKNFYEEKKKEAFLTMIYSFSKPRYREPLDKEKQETLNKFVRQVYNPRFKKLKEEDYFMEEWMETDIKAKP